MDADTRISITDFIGNAGITSKCVRADSNPNMDSMGEGARHWIVTLKSGNYSMRVPFSQGSAHTAEPTTSDVLDCLAADAAGFDNCKSFEDWASDYGYDIDSRKAHRIYKAVERQSSKLQAMLGDANYETLLWKTERL